MKTMTIALFAALLVAAGTVHAQAPVRPGEAPRTDPSRSVTLSLTEYNRLIDLAGRPTPPPAGAPVASLLASADLRVRVDRDTVRGTFSLAGDVLRPGVTRVNLISGATLLDATADGRPLPLAADGPTHSALLSGPGPFAVTLEWGAPLAFTPGRASFVLPVPPSGTARATIDVPGEQADVHVANGVVSRRVAAGGRTVVDVTLKPGRSSEVWWSMRDAAPVAAAREVRMLADVLTLVTIGDSDLRMNALVDVTVAQGEPRTIDVRLPSGYELAGISGSAIESSEPRAGGVVLTVLDPGVRRIQFLVSLERAHAGGSFKTDTDLIALPGMQRERGEIAIEGVGTMELQTSERPGMHRIDVKEINGALQSLARLPILAAYRYQRSASAPVAVEMDVQRFPDAGVLAAVADRAIVTTLVTAEGRALTEIVLHVRNRAQPFLKVTLPAGATIASVEVAGESAKPVVGSDGTRVPLLRSGFRPSGVYQVSYVYVHAGTPFAKKGELQMALPRMDIPVTLVEWEMFVPDGYRVQVVDGNVIKAEHVVPALGMGYGSGAGGYVAGGVAGGVVGGLAASEADRLIPMARISVAPGALLGQVHGTVRDVSGAVIPGARVVLRAGGTERAGVSGSDGSFLFTAVPSGTVAIDAELSGFNRQNASFNFDGQPRRVDFALGVGSAHEQLTVTAEAPPINTPSARIAGPQNAPRPAPPPPVAAPSQNVINLQKRAAGVLPIRVDVPRAGTSHRFVKPLVVDQEATVRLKYRRR